MGFSFGIPSRVSIGVGLLCFGAFNAALAGGISTEQAMKLKTPQARAVAACKINSSQWKSFAACVRNMANYGKTVRQIVKEVESAGFGRDSAGSMLKAEAAMGCAFYKGVSLEIWASMGCSSIDEQFDAAFNRIEARAAAKAALESAGGPSTNRSGSKSKKQRTATSESAKRPTTGKKQGAGEDVNPTPGCVTVSMSIEACSGSGNAVNTYVNASNACKCTTEGFTVYGTKVDGDKVTENRVAAFVKPLKPGETVRREASNCYGHWTNYSFTPPACKRR